MLKLNTSRLKELFKAISENQALYLPVNNGGQANFGRYSEDALVCIDKLKTSKSAKDLFFPQSEKLMTFKMEGKEISLTEEEYSKEKFVIFGVRACDARSFEILDRVFLSEPFDPYYKARRENGTIVSLGCSEPDETCFCNVFGIDSAEPSGDVCAWINGDTLYWDCKTEKGRTLTESIHGLFEEASENDLNKIESAKNQTRELMKKLPLADLKLEGFKGDVLLEKFNSPKWAELSKSCLGCGSCTFVCPTCQCYDIKDYDTGHGIQRYRCWDSCMYSDFTMMAHGTPRPTQLEKFRQRFMHKLVYFPANNDGIFSCVGCGRCISKCPISMNIAKVIKALGEDENV